MLIVFECLAENPKHILAVTASTRIVFTFLSVARKLDFSHSETMTCIFVSININN